MKKIVYISFYTSLYWLDGSYLFISGCMLSSDCTKLYEDANFCRILNLCYIECVKFYLVVRQRKILRSPDMNHFVQLHLLRFL
jgi:hypothetical protein